MGDVSLDEDAGAGADAAVEVVSAPDFLPVLHDETVIVAANNSTGMDFSIMP